MAATLARTALEFFPDADDVRQMWSRWIYGGQFDGAPAGPLDLAIELGVADEHHLPGWEPVQDALRNHVRGLLRKPSRDRVWTAIAHLQANADQSTPLVARLVREMEGVSGSSEWNEWAETDPEAVEDMRWFVHAHAREAQGDRNWPRAIEEAERTIAFERTRRGRLQARRGAGQ